MTANLLRTPVHVVYGGADRYSADTPRKLGDIALKTLHAYAPNFADFARAIGLPGNEKLPTDPDCITKLDRQIGRSQTKAREEQFTAWYAWTVYRKSIAKLEQNPVEDFRIDFEDGYGFRPDEEEDIDAIRAASELASAFKNETITPFCGFRIKSLAPETRKRGLRTLELFLTSFVDNCGETFPENFVVTLPKITDKKQVRDLCDRLKKFEKKNKLSAGSIGVELMIETPQAIFDRSGNIALRSLVDAAKGRCTSAHFGAFDYTSALGIVSTQQHLDHPSCDLARQLMLANLAPLGIRLSDSVTTRLPVTINRKGRLTKTQHRENHDSIYDGLGEHFANVTRSMQNGFYQSWDLHPNQLPARFAAVYAFFIEAADSMSHRLNENFALSTKATLTGNAFDDAASAEGMLNFFRKGLGCGAFDGKEIKKMIAFSADELSSFSFAELAQLHVQKEKGGIAAARSEFKTLKFEIRNLRSETKP
ncbi:MAG: phosphoenolpyruvate kinase [Acidobacteria bacterium]|nr:MAG: phosphoenolpyruvate kinase [Acidobacteriota bacterium]